MQPALPRAPAGPRPSGAPQPAGCRTATHVNPSQLPHMCTHAREVQAATLHLVRSPSTKPKRDDYIGRPPTTCLQNGSTWSRGPTQCTLCIPRDARPSSGSCPWLPVATDRIRCYWIQHFTASVVILQCVIASCPFQGIFDASSVHALHYRTPHTHVHSYPGRATLHLVCGAFTSSNRLPFCTVLQPLASPARSRPDACVSALPHRTRTLRHCEAGCEAFCCEARHGS